MQNQANYDKVNKWLLAPLVTLFNVKQTDELIEGFVEELSRYSDETLRNAFTALRRTQKRFPTIAHAIEACEAEKPKITTNINPKKQETFYCTGKAESIHPQVVATMMGSPAGQLALQLGVARDMLVEFENTGRTEFDVGFVRECKRKADDAVRELIRVPEASPLGTTLHAFFNAMQAREKRLFAEFGAKLSAVSDGVVA